MDLTHQNFVNQPANAETPQDQHNTTTNNYDIAIYTILGSFGNTVLLF